LLQTNAEKPHRTALNRTAERRRNLMWKKSDVASPTTSVPPPESRPPRTEPEKPVPSVTERATIGRSITIRGDVTGDEDLVIQGRVEGSVDLALHSVTVGTDGRVEANISGRVVTVEGTVDGNLQAKDQIVLSGSARVQGDIMAPRVVLKDGATFRGRVDMGDPSAAKGHGDDASSAKAEAGTKASDSFQAESEDEKATADELVQALP
jgi:cytoskeletal protein CcmA (bactofilin family)